MASKSGGEETNGTQSISYSEKVLVNVKKSERLRRNVLEISLEYDEVNQSIDKEMVANTFSTLGIDIKNHLEGYQVTPRKIFAWCKENISLDKFCREECIRIASGIKTGFIKPMENRNVTVTIRGLNLNTPDSLVMEYLSKFGSIAHKKVVYDVDKEGPFAGLRNGDRKYLVDFSAGRNMGTFHIIDGISVTVRYSGQRRTCGRCYQTAISCPGGGWAKTCEENEGPKVTLQDHMLQLWSSIGFQPREFLREYSEGEEVVEKLVEIKENPQFTPPSKLLQRPSQDTENFNGLIIRNFPKDIPENEILKLLEEHGLPSKHEHFNITRNKKTTKVDIASLPSRFCNLIIGNIHEKEFFNQKLYCRAVLDLSQKDEPKQAIPGLPAEALAKNKKKGRTKTSTPDRSEFLRKYVDRPREDEYVFNDVDTGTSGTTLSSKRDLEITPEAARRVKLKGVN